jgi:hypothetical protein
MLVISTKLKKRRSIAKTKKKGDKNEKENLKNAQ